MAKTLALTGTLALAALLAGCGFTPQGDAVRDAVKARGAQAYDEGLENAEWFICQAASIGSVRRRYGDSEPRLIAYRTLCELPSAGSIVGVRPSEERLPDN